jgi:AraC family transcriptional regulator
MIDQADSSASPKMSARIRGGASTFSAEGTWSRGRVYGAIKHWSGAEPELVHKRPQHTFVLTLSGGTDLTGTRISGSPPYEGRDAAGCVTFVPSGAERRGWYRNADMNFFVLLVDPDFVQLCDFGLGAGDLQPFTNRRDRLLESVLWSLASEMRHAGAQLPSLYAEHAAGLLTSHLMRLTRRGQSRASSGRGLSEARLRLILDFVEENLHREISLSDLGGLVGMGPDVFARNFKVHLGISPYRYVMERRIRRAEVLLATQEESIAEIALAVGFSSQGHFTTQFSKLLHVTPAAYRALHRT